MNIYLDEETDFKIDENLIEKMYQVLETAIVTENDHRIYGCGDSKELAEETSKKDSTFLNLISDVEEQLKALDLDKIQVSLTTVSKEEIRDINKEYRGIDKVTDVLSFPQFEDVYVEASNCSYMGEILLGDVIIASEVAEEQAKEYGHSIEREMTYLFCHSILHLLGYDHEVYEEKSLMRMREEEIMSALGITRD